MSSRPEKRSDEGPPCRRRALRLLAALGATAIACHDGSVVTQPSDPSNTLPGMDVPGITTSGPGVFTVSPLDTTTLALISPLGQLGPPGHVLPTDHIYLLFVDPYKPIGQDCTPRPIYAAAAGVVDFMLQPEGNDWKVSYRVTKTFSYYYDHIIPVAGTAIGRAFAAGERVGTTNGRCPSFDMGVVDLGVTRTGLLTPERYGASTLHMGAPLSYFTEPLRSALYRRIDRVASDPNRDGRIDYGIRGRLIGDWFLPSLPRTPSSTGSPDGWSKSLAFVYDNRDPSIIRVSIGGTLPIGLWAVEGNAPDPATVSMASGKVVYKLIPYGGNSQPGMLAVQMIADDRIRIQVFIGSTNPNPSFDNGAVEYIR